MKVVIPLAGFGTRLRPHTFTKPKPLFSVAGKAVLGHLIDKLSGLDVSEYIFITGYLGDQIEKYIRENYKVKAQFVEQKEMLGQAHAISLAREYLQTDEAVFVIFADTLFETDLNTLKSFTDDALIFVKEVEDPRRFGVAALDAQGYITRFVEKPSTDENKLAVVGLYYFSSGKKLINAVDQLLTRKDKMLKGEFFLADAMTMMIEGGAKFRTQPITVWLDAGLPDAVLETNRYLLAHGNGNTEEARAAAKNSAIIEPVYIHPSAKIEGSVIGPHVAIGANVKVTGSIIRDSVIDDSAEITNAVLEQSLIGQKAKVDGRASVLNIGDTSSAVV